MTRVYLAGPMSNRPPDFNRAGFEAAARYVAQWQPDWTAVSPWGIDPGHEGECPDNAGHLVRHGDHAHPYGCWLKASLRLLLTCDAVLMLWGWHASVGASLEREIAVTCHMPIYHM